MKWASIIPLIGGFSIAAENELNSEPEFILSYPSFKLNDSQYLFNKNLNDKYFVLSENNEFLNIEDKNKFNLLNKNIDIVTAIPPCSGLSLLNSSISNNQVKNKDKSRGSSAIQNRFMYLTSEFVLSNIQPKVFIFENAPAFYTINGKQVLEKVIEIGNKYNYSFSAIKTSTIKHGIPQNRTRSFGILWKSETTPIINWYNKKYLDIEDYLNLIPNNSVYHDLDFNTKRFENNFFVKFIISKEGLNFRNIFEKESSSLLYYIVSNKLIDEGIKFADKNNFKSESKLLNFVKYKLSINKGFWDSSPVIVKKYVNSVISKNSFRSIHPSQNRFFTLRENMWLMGLPNDFILSNIKFSNMITQNVPVNTAQDMIKECVKFINGELKFSNSKILKQNNINQTIEYFNQTSKKSFINLI